MQAEMSNFVVKKEPSSDDKIIEDDDGLVEKIVIKLICPSAQKRMASGGNGDENPHEKTKKICHGSTEMMEPQMLSPNFVIRGANQKQEETLQLDIPGRRSRAAKVQSQVTSKFIFDHELSSSDDTSEEMESYETEISQRKRRRQMVTSYCDSDTSEEEEEKNKRSRKTHKYLKCPKSYNTTSGLVARTKTHKVNGGTKVVRKKTNKCEVCQKMFGSRIDVERHMTSHTGERPYKCPHCSDSFTRETHLTEHQLRHFEKKNFVCSTCSKPFRTPSDLRKHAMLHEEKKLKCFKCDMKFHYQSELKKHENTHIDVKPFECKVCKKRFTEAGNRNRHERTHTDATPYSCEHCDKKFNDSSHQVRHTRTCNDRLNKNKCPQCPQRFPYKKALTAHMQVHETSVKLEVLNPEY